MDQACFVSTSKSHINYMSVTAYDGGVVAEEDARKIYLKTINQFPKFRYNIKMFFGDMYYGDMLSVEETMEKAFTYFSEDKMIRT